MATIRIEPSDMTKSAICAQCGGSIRRAHGFVYANESAHGVYFLGRCAGVHPVRAAFLTVALGEFTVEASSNRQSFAVEWRMEGMGLMDCPVRDHPELLGRFVPRSAALALPDLGHLWHVVDHIILDDVHARTVGRWLAGWNVGRRHAKAVRAKRAPVPSGHGEPNPARPQHRPHGVRADQRAVR